MIDNLLLKHNIGRIKQIHSLQITLTISQAPRMMPARMLEYLRPKQCSGSSTNSAIGLDSSTTENSSPPGFQLPMLGDTPRYSLKACWEESNNGF